MNGNLVKIYKKSEKCFQTKYLFCFLLHIGHVQWWYMAYQLQKSRWNLILRVDIKVGSYDIIFLKKSSFILCFSGTKPRNIRSDKDCSQFSTGYDVLYHFSFFIMINPINNDWQKSTAHMDENSTLVVSLKLINEDSVPLSVFCLKNLIHLEIFAVSFLDGNSSLWTNSSHLKCIFRYCTE